MISLLRTHQQHAQSFCRAANMCFVRPASRFSDTVEEAFIRGILARQQENVLDSSLVGKEREIEEEIKTRRKEILESNKSKFSLTDARIAEHLGQASLVLAAFDVLKKRTDDSEQAVNIVTDYMKDMGELNPLAHVLAMRLKIPWGRRSAVKRTLSSMQSDFGEYFHSVLTTSEEAEGLTVSRCFYKDFFDQNDGRELLPLFCKLESSLYKRIRRDAHSVEYRVDGTLADGHDKCSFLFEFSETVKK